MVLDVMFSMSFNSLFLFFWCLFSVAIFVTIFIVIIFTYKGYFWRVLAIVFVIIRVIIYDLFQAYLSILFLRLINAFVRSFLSNVIFTAILDFFSAHFNFCLSFDDS